MADQKKKGFLENYAESVSMLPVELRRNFMLMRELDGRSQQLLENIDQGQKTFVANQKSGQKASSSDPPAEEVVVQIRNDFQKCMEYADEKVALALQTYEMVDKHIRRLDTDLKKFEAELEAGGANVGALSEREKQRRDKRQRTGQTDASGAPLDNASASVPPSRLSMLQADMDMPVDPNEPTYCTCNRVSYGEMCVGLKESPKGRWYCPNCSASLTS